MDIRFSEGMFVWSQGGPVVTSLLSQDAPLEVRQMAGVLLKQFSENSWQECPHTASKDVVKANILPGLGDSLSKVRLIEQLDINYSIRDAVF